MEEVSLSGRELARLFHSEVVAPVLARAMPRLRYAAGRLGSGSDVLGLDDQMSRDHDWGCRLTLLVDGADAAAVPLVSGLLERELPDSFRGLPVRFPVTWDRSATHNVEVATVAGFAASRLGADPVAGLTVPDWLTLTGQSVLEVTAGPVFTDQTRELAPARSLLAWYPAGVERYVLACGWQKIAEEMPMIGRAASRGDETGSRLISARLAVGLMGLAFALSRRWAPYPKWRGTAFAGLPVAADLAAPLAAASSAPHWRARQDGLAAASEALLAAQRALGLPGPATAVIPFWNRPYRTIDEAIPRALLAGVTDPQITGLPAGIGSIEQWADNVAILTSPEHRQALKATYHPRHPGPPGQPARSPDQG